MADEISEMSGARKLTAYSFLAVFANDGTIDEAELKHLEKIALEDGVVDEEEKHVLANLFSRVDKTTLTEAVWKEICAFREKHGIE